MTQSEVEEATYRLNELKKELQDIQGIAEFVSGNAMPGDKPNLVARAVRDGISIPLKYTHSYHGLRSLFNYALSSKDLQLYQWVENQVSTFLSPATLAAFQDQRPPETQLPTPKETARRFFLKNYKKMDLDQLYSFQFRGDIPQFFASQISRLSKINNLRASDLKLPSAGTAPVTISAFLSELFLKESGMVRSHPLHPFRVITTNKISSLVAATALIECNSRIGWAAIIENEQFWKKKVLIRKCRIPIDLCIQKLKAAGASDQLIAQVQANFH